MLGGRHQVPASLGNCLTSVIHVCQVKMEQDLAIRQAEEEAMRHHHFKANPLPKSTTEPR